MSSENPVFSQIVRNARVGRGPVIASDGSPISGSHRGVDLAVAIGTSITPVAEGKVVYAGYREDYGNVVVVQHNLPRGKTGYSLYAHMDEFPYVIKNQAVNSDTTLGLSGSTGRSTGPHLHFEMVERTIGQPGPVSQTVSGTDLLKDYFSYQLLDPKANPYGLLTWDPRRVDRDDLTKLERVAQLRLNDTEFESYKTQLASIETKGKSVEESYQTTSKSGEYLGRYQIGKSTGLIEAGYMDKAGNWTEYAKTQGIASTSDFLNKPGAQDDALRRLTEKNAEFAVRNDLDLYIGETIRGKALTGAGVLLGAHNSREHVDDYIKSFGEMNGVDGNGFGISNYIALGDKVQPNQIASSISGSAPTPAGRWEEQTTYTFDVGIPLGTSMVWVPGSAVTTAAPSSPASPNSAPPTNHTTTGAIYLSRDGASATLPDGQVINAGPGGRLELTADGNLSATRPAAGYGPDERVYSITLYNKSSQVIASTQVQVVADPAHPTDPSYDTTLVQGQARDIEQLQPDGTIIIIPTMFQAGFGWVEPATGEVIQSIAKPSAEQLALSDFEKAFIYAIQNPRVIPGPGTQYANAGSPTVSDAGGGSAGPEPTNTNSYRDFLNGAGSNLTPSQQDVLAAQLQSLNLGSETGEGALSFITLPGGSTVITNVDGDIVGEISSGKAGFIRLVSNRILEDGGIEPVVSYVTPRGEPASQAAYDKAADAAQAAEVGSALGLMQSIIGLDHWENMSDLQRVATVASIYNAVGKLTDGQLPGDFGSAVAVLGLLNALDKRDIGGIAYSGIAVVDFFGDGMASQAIGNALGIEAANVLPGLGFVLALDSGDPVSIASSGLSLLSSLGYIGPWGTAAAAVISVLGAMGVFGESIPDIPMREGIAHAEWDAAGNTTIITDQDIEGGGATAAGWMSSLVHGLQTQLASMHDKSGNSYALVPNLLPAIGFQYDPDGFNLGNGAKGFMVLRWTDEAGQPQARYYDGAGSRGDGSGETLAGDFMAHAKAAIAPDWQVATTLAHFQQGQGIELPATSAGLPQATGDGIHQSLQALSLSLPIEPALADSLLDIDGDGYLEQSQWLANNQSVLAIDLNGNENIDAGELLSLNGAGLNSLNWLDANGDQVIDAKDPAFAALRLWIDVNSDGGSDGETRGLTLAGITAIDFASNPPVIVRADGSRTTLTVQTLTANTLGTRYQNTEGGILQLDEQRNADGTLAAAAATLHAVNTRQFDGQAAHINGGVEAATTPGASNSLVDALDARLGSASARTIVSQSAQTSTTINVGDSRLQNGAAGPTQVTSTAVTATIVRSNALAFVPLAGTGTAQEQRQVLESMIRSAGSNVFDIAGGALPLAALAAGAAAVQWPTLASAGDNDVQDSNAHATRQTGIAGQAHNESQILLSLETVNVIPNLTGDARTADQFRNDSYRSTPDTVSAQSHPISSVQSTFGADNELFFANFTTQQSATYTSGTAASLTPDVIPNLLREPGVSVSASQGTTLTTAAGVLLDYPRTQSERASGVEDTVLRFAETLLLANDSTVNAAAFPNQPSLRITSVFAPTHGSVALQTGADGTTQVVFNPDANYHGFASFSYTVTDQYGLSSQATTTLSIAAVNDAPVTQGEAASGDEDTTLRFTAASLLANDSDVDTAVDGDVLRITRVGGAQHGQAFLAADGIVSFVPDLNYNGLAEFSYWVGDRAPSQIATAGNEGDGFEIQANMRLTILPVNDLPVVTGETLASDEDIVLNINPALLLANDTDVDVATNSQVLSISAVSNAQHGAIALLPDGNLQFTPERDYFGAAGFSYTVSDGNGGLVVGQVLVNLAPVNDAPTLVGETIAFNEEDVQTVSAASLLANDTDADNPHSDLRIISVGNATHGSVALNPDGSIRFAPDADYFGPALFTYTVSDGSGGFSVGTATLDIAPVNDAPRLLGESLTLDEDTQASFSIASLLANDTDVDNEHSELMITSLAMDADGAANGSVSISNGQVIFTPTLNFNGQASFSYTVSDGVGGICQASVNLTFNPINDAPVANSELVFGKKDITYTLAQAALLANDTDVETPNNLRINSISNMQHGAATLAADGSVRFTPTAGYDGRGSFDYVVTDLHGATSTATAQIDFSRVNTSPITTDDSFIGFEDVPFIIAAAQLLVNDRDADNALADLRVTAVNNATNGTVSLQADGSVRFVANANFYGNASFTYQVSDGNGGLTWATAQLTVQSVNDAPIIEDIWYGRPVYGTSLQPLTSDELGNAMTYGYVNVTVESQALSLLASGLLVGSSGSYYQNGHLRPVGLTNLDGRALNEDGVYVDVDVPYRQQGSIVAYDPDGNSSQISFSLATTPQHGHAWTNQYTNINAPYNADHTQIGGDWVAETGAWQYFSQRGDPYSGGDPFNITVTDAQGASTNVNIGAYHTGSSAAGGGGKKPVTLDLNGNGLHYIGIDDSKAYFDVNNDGWREHIAWIAPDDGLLVRDIGDDGRIERYDEISFTSYLIGAKTDLEGLTAFDSNHDGVLTRLDTRWKEFAVWQDKNSDGVSDPGEVRTLDDIGIAQIGLVSDHQIRIVNGVTEHGQSQFAWADLQGGQTGTVGDVSLPVDLAARVPASGALTPALHTSLPAIPVIAEFGSEVVAAPPLESLPTSSIPPATMPTPMQMALVMTQMINALTAPDSGPLTFIPLGNETEPQQALEQTQDHWEQVALATPLEMAHA
ncbi:MAG: cadherin-like domain-containing protein [Pseudomonadota bacterium]